MAGRAGSAKAVKHFRVFLLPWLRWQQAGELFTSVNFMSVLICPLSKRKVCSRPISQGGTSLGVSKPGSSYCSAKSATRICISLLQSAAKGALVAKENMHFVCKL